jgi:hypothetical protein
MREPFCIVKICSDRSLRRVQWRRSKSQKGVSKHSQNSGPAGTSFTMRKQKSGFPGDSKRGAELRQLRRVVRDFLRETPIRAPHI